MRCQHCKYQVTTISWKYIIRNLIGLWLSILCVVLLFHWSINDHPTNTATKDRQKSKFIPSQSNENEFPIITIIVYTFLRKALQKTFDDKVQCVPKERQSLIFFNYRCPVSSTKYSIGIDEGRPVTKSRLIIDWPVNSSLSAINLAANHPCFYPGFFPDVSSSSWRFTAHRQWAFVGIAILSPRFRRSATMIDKPWSGNANNLPPILISTKNLRACSVNHWHCRSTKGEDRSRSSSSIAVLWIVHCVLGKKLCLALAVQWRFFSDDRNLKMKICSYWYFLGVLFRFRNRIKAKICRKCWKYIL